MADFTNNNIQDTYQRVLQIDSGEIQNGTGSVVLSSTELVSIQAIGTPAITSGEWSQIKNIGTSTISSTQWGYLGALNQGLTTNHTPEFSSLILSTAREGFEAITLPSLEGTNTTATHIRVDNESNATPSVRFGHYNADHIVEFIDQNDNSVAVIKQSGEFTGTVTNGLTTNTAQNITGVKTLSTTTKLQFRDAGIYLNSNTDGTLQIVSDNKVNIFGDVVKIYAPLTASGNIWVSGSGNNIYLNNGHITASGNISASGNVTANNVTANNATINEGYLTIDGSGVNHGFKLQRDGLDTYRIRHLDGGLTIQNSSDSRKEMTFDGTGNVGVGVTNPDVKFHVSGDTKFNNAYVLDSIKHSGDSDTQIKFTTDTIGFDTAGSERATIKSDGNIGIGNITPPEKLTVEGNISASGEIKTDSHVSASGDISASKYVSQDIILSNQVVYFTNPEQNEITTGNANHGYDSDTLGGIIEVDGSPEEISLLGNEAHGGFVVPFDIKDIDLKAYYRPAQTGGGSTAPFSGTAASATINSGDDCTLEIHIYESDRPDANNSTITLTRLGVASDTLAAGAKNKHFYTCDLPAPIPTKVSAGQLIHLGFEFSSLDSSLSPVLDGNIKISYTLTARRA